MKKLLSLTNIIFISISLFSACNKKSNPASKSKMENKSENSGMSNTNSTQTKSNNDKPTSTDQELKPTKDTIRIYNHPGPDQDRIDSIKNENFKAKKKK